MRSQGSQGVLFVKKLNCEQILNVCLTVNGLVTYLSILMMPEVYSIMMCNDIFIIHASNIFILIICMLTQPG